jgi:UrcA family protein
MSGDIMKKHLKLLGIPALLCTAFAAQAQNVTVTSDYLKMNWQTVTSEVPFGDLNLKDPKAVEVLKARVKTTAEKMCGDKGTALKDKQNNAICYDSVMASAEPQIEQVVAAAKAK